MSKPTVFILGKLPPPWYGPAIATDIILKSKLKESFNIIHINTGLNASLHSMGHFAWWKPFKGLSIYFSYLIKLIKFRPSLILIPNGQTTPSFIKDSVFIIFGRLFGSKILLHLRGSDWKNWLNGSNTITRWYVKRNLKLASGVIVLGEKLKYLFADSFPDERIYVVPNGANFNFPARQEINQNALKILFFSNLISTKGVEDVLNAAEHLGVDNLQFQFVGAWNNNEFKESCISKVKDKRLNVEFLPPASGDIKVKLLSEADIFVFPPRIPEGHPWVIVEAMAAGLPIISTDQGAITESVKDGINGFIVESNNSKQIADRIQQLINNPELRVEMGRMSRKNYIEKFTEEKMIERLTNVFNSALQR